MAPHGNNPLLGLYGMPRSIVRSRVSDRAKSAAPGCKGDAPEKIGSAIVSLTSLRDDEPSSR